MNKVRSGTQRQLTWLSLDPGFQYQCHWDILQYGKVYYVVGSLRVVHPEKQPCKLLENFSLMTTHGRRLRTRDTDTDSSLNGHSVYDGLYLGPRAGARWWLSQNR